jgi:hypothetical protein
MISHSDYLQQILGTDKRNPVFTIFRDEKQDHLRVYYGADLLEIVPDNREHPAYKLLITRLYNANLNASVLEQVFKVDRKTMKRWGSALRSGDLNKLEQALAGRQARRKLTPAIQSYIRMRFPAIYEKTKYDYSKQIREEIEQVFGASLSGETLRSFLKELKETEKSNEAPSCDCAREKPIEEKEKSAIPPSNPEDRDQSDLPSPTEDDKNRKTFPNLQEENQDEEIILCHHVGVLLFSVLFTRLDDWIGEESWLLKQWVATILLGAVNIEQTKTLDFDDLKRLLGKCLRSLNEQRSHLGRLATQDVVERILRFNADEAHTSEETDFYYDPHTKRYTGMQKALKGWCPSVRLADKALHMDFLHTSTGSPVYLDPTDNYEDLRERAFKFVQKFRNLLEMDQDKIITLIVDRGIYSHQVFQKVIEDPALHLITWERNYKASHWNERGSMDSFTLERHRNCSTDLQLYSFEYMDEKWDKDPAMRRVRVRATNPKGRTIEVGILTDDLKRSAQEIVTLIFRRWIQENDFKYLDKHFGINEITSYAVIPYERLQERLEDKEMKSGAYKALEMERSQTKRKLEKLLFQEHQHPGKNAGRTKEIQHLSERLREISEEMKTTEKEMSRLEFLIEQDYVRLDTRNKYVMDGVKLLARNMFYKMLEPFKKEYDNYRDDHVLFRELTRSDGVIRSQGDRVEVILLPKPNYPPKVRRIIENYLEEINATQPRMPDGTKRQILFQLGTKSGIEIAIVSKEK